MRERKESINEGFKGEITQKIIKNQIEFSDVLASHKPLSIKRELGWTQE